MCKGFNPPLFLSSFADEREAVQKKTFTKWVNSHLGRVTCRIGDLYTDLRDGRMLIRLLEVLSGEQLVSITEELMLYVPILTHTLRMTLTSQEEGEIMCFISCFLFFFKICALLLLLLLVFLFLNSCQALSSSTMSTYVNLYFSAASPSQNLLRAACVSTALKMLTKPYSFLRSKKFIWKIWAHMTLWMGITVSPWVSSGPSSFASR